MLQYGAQGDSKSLQPDKRTTAGERHEENSEIKRGIYPREDSREQAEQLLDGFKAFKPEYTALFDKLLCTLPETEDEDGEGAY